jgi:hypothetical protein
MAPCTPSPPRHHPGTTLDLSRYHRTVYRSPKHSPPPAPAPLSAPPVASTLLMPIRRRFPATRQSRRDGLPVSERARLKWLRHAGPETGIGTSFTVGAFASNARRLLRPRCNSFRVGGHSSTFSQRRTAPLSPGRSNAGLSEAILSGLGIRPLRDGVYPNPVCRAASCPLPCALFVTWKT